ncbi:hypothetical protein [Kitasatospora sp. NPDC051914]|uniref:hypothetical protein n=1 Tax=Kitasatospora sp. NPDC051914 TaxID=3154945 RepID=UPI00343B3291
MVVNGQNVQSQISCSSKSTGGGPAAMTDRKRWDRRSAATGRSSEARRTRAADRMGDRAAVESYAIRLDTQLQYLNAELQPATAELLHALADPSDPRTAYARR